MTPHAAAHERTLLLTNIKSPLTINSHAQENRALELYNLSVFYTIFSAEMVKKSLTAQNQDWAPLGGE